MKKILVIVLPLLISLSSCTNKEGNGSAIKAVNTELLASVPEKLLVNELLQLKPAAGHHFEMKAPQSCAGFPFELKTARSMHCQIGAPGVHKIELSVCDDKKTYCKFVVFGIEVDAPKGYDASGKAAQTVLQPPKHPHPALSGFLMNEPDKALAQAKKEGKLLLIDFYGIWCPPCNMLEEYVYKKKAFLDASDDVVRIMLDADSDLSWEWKGRFKVGGYPTVVLADANLEEIDRLVGYRPLGSVLKWLKEGKTHKNSPVSQLVHKYSDPASASALVRKRIGQWYYRRGEYENALHWLKDHPDSETRQIYYYASRRKASEEGDDAAVREAVRALVAEFPEDVGYAGWVEELFDAKDPSAKKHLNAALASLAHWRTSPKLADTGMILPEIYWQEAALRKAAGDEAGAKDAFLKTAKAYEEMAERSDLKIARGANLERAWSLHQAGENAQAKALYEKLAGAYSDEFTFNYNYAYVLHALKEYPQAYEYVQKAEVNSYGDNWLRSVYLKAKLELALGENKQARNSIERALKEAVVPKSTAVRTHTYLARLRKLLAKT